MVTRPGSASSPWVGILGSVEVVVIAFIGHSFLPPQIAWALDAAGVPLLVLPAFAIASVLWRMHAVTDTDVVLVLGYLGGHRKSRIGLELDEAQVGRRLWQRRPVTRVKASDDGRHLAAQPVSRLQS